MAKKTQKLSPDIVVKNYWKDNGRFADFFNAALFGGKQVILPEELEDSDTDVSTVLEKKQYAETIKEFRDNIKIRKKSTAFGAELAMVGLESQQHVHYAMPMRVMGYDYATYKKQYQGLAAGYQKGPGGKSSEFLSKMKKGDKLIPVITAVLYYGEEPWDGATTLHGMLDIPEELAGYVNDYKMLLVEAREHGLVFHNKSNIDFFHLLGILLDRGIPREEAKEKAIRYSEEHNTSKDVVMTVAGATNTKIDYSAFEKGDGKMCTLFEEIARTSEDKGRLEGRAEGRLEGRAEEIISMGLESNFPENSILETLQNRLGITLQKATEYFRRFAGQRIQ